MTLTEYYWQEYIDKHSWEDRNHPILLLDDVLIVNFASLFNRNYSIAGTDQLIYQTHRLGHGKKFIFVCEDGVNPIQSGIKEIIKTIIRPFNLNPNTCVIFCRDHLDIPEATLILEDSVEMWGNILWPTIKDIPFYQGPFEKKFAGWFNRGTFYRLQIAKLLYENYRSDSFISYQEYGILYDQPFSEHFEDEINWSKENTPIVYDQLFPNRIYTHEMIVSKSRKPYDQYFMEIIVETDCVSNTWITEKTVKNLYIGKPFLLMCGAYSLKKLREQGFQTFDQWFDESYDNELNNYDRFEKIKKEINRIGNMSLEEINLIFHDMIPVLTYNRNHYLKLLKNV